MQRRYPYQYLLVKRASLLRILCYSGKANISLKKIETACGHCVNCSYVSSYSLCPGHCEKREELDFGWNVPGLTHRLHLDDFAHL